MGRCINYKHNLSQILLFSLSDCSVCLVAGVGGKLSRPVDPAPPPPTTLVSKYNYFANSTYFNLSDCEDVSIINIIQVKFSCFLCWIVPYT